MSRSDTDSRTSDPSQQFTVPISTTLAGIRRPAHANRALRHHPRPQERRVTRLVEPQYYRTLVESSQILLQFTCFRCLRVK
jgi:hypothetical protein